MARPESRTVLAGAAALVVVAIAVTLPTWLRGEPVEPFTAAAGPSRSCPPFTDAVPRLGQGAAGVVVHEGAVRATLCVYRPDLAAASGWQTDTAVIDQDTADVIDVLNALPDHAEFAAQHPEADGAGCFGSLRPQYRLLFEYSDGAERMVVFAMNCGTVESGDVVRYGEITKVLDEFTKLYRAQGGDVPAPPWKW